MKFRPKLEILTNEEVYEIHQTSLQILNRIGIKIPSTSLLEKLESMGAIVDYRKNVAKFPEHLVMEMVKKAKKRFTIYARNPKKNIKFGYGEILFQSNSGERYIVDLIAKTRCEGTREDMIKAIKLGDALEGINIVGNMVWPMEIPPSVRDVHTFAELIKNSSKPVASFIFSGIASRYIINMFEILAGGKEELQKNPMLYCAIEPTSPLLWGSNALELLYEFASRGLPVLFGPMVQASVSGPATLAGTLALENAEILGAITLAQTLHPGLPVMYWGIPHLIDQKTCFMRFASPEVVLMGMAMAQIARYYNIPSVINLGMTDSNCGDAQFGVEAGMVILGILAGADLYGHLGIVGQDQGSSLEQLVIHDEVIRYLLRIVRGIEVNDETLALDVIEKVGIGGTFLKERHTLKYIRSEYWFPELFNIGSWDSWYKKGARDVLKLAAEKVEEILKSHQPEPLDKDIEKQINEIVYEADRTILRKI